MMAHYLFTEFQRKLLFISVEVGLAQGFTKQFLGLIHPCFKCWPSQDIARLETFTFKASTEITI